MTNNNLNQPFSDELVNFHSLMMDCRLPERFPRCIFFRDYEQLPERAPFDIDLLIDEASLNAFSDTLESLASNCGLVYLKKYIPNGMLVLILDVTGATNRRTWSYYEIRFGLQITASVRLKASDIGVREEKGLLVPTTGWRFFLLIYQGLRKHKLEKYRAELIDTLDTAQEGLDLCQSYLNLSEADVRGLLAAESYEDWSPSKPAVDVRPSKPRLRTKMRLFVFRHFYFLHFHKPILFTVHGADGVGKSTVCDQISDILGGYPLPVSVSHHITGWKYPGKQAKTTSTAVDPPYWRVILRVIYRNSPTALRRIWTHGIGYHTYCKNLNKYMYDKYVSNTLMVSDRYIFDIWAKNKIQNRGRILLDTVGLLFTRMMRKPRKAYLIIDDPQKIFSRKQELTVEEIEAFQGYIATALAHRSVHYARIDVDSRPAQEVATDILKDILYELGPQTIDLMKHHVSANKSKYESMSGKYRLRHKERLK